MPMGDKVFTLLGLQQKTINHLHVGGLKHHLSTWPLTMGCCVNTDFPYKETIHFVVYMRSIL